ncbi:ribonucleases P/MRP protein subunit POP1-like [Pollicipes pollicipes]|uniref:ribonucleases P/MRP protein subunit POP1-like n=1 Tax=Pollicipes pollicipes TaxID=41117 RepID=UPI0018851A1F|nr:ribonucleases P/MRP protein subunit POP1-like [Pollicipes pollicipes]
MEVSSHQEEPVFTGKNISFLELTAERANEIQRLTDAIENPNRTKMAYQRLPRHMQRRAMSHDPRRLPVRLRQVFEQQVSASSRPMSQPKRPSRRHRRRPSQLLQEYNRRQREHVWLETHIWHARRFHMVRRWGYRLPERATDKGFRAAYRATAHHCLVQDVSYLCQLELGGSQERLLAPREEPVPDGPLEAERDPTATEADSGDVMDSGGDAPAPAGQAAAPADPAEAMGSSDAAAAPAGTPHKNVDRLKLAPRRLDVIRRHVGADGSVALTELRDRLVRLRLSGPGAQAVLQACLRVADAADASSAGVSAACLERQRALWRAVGQAQSPAELPAGCVLGMVVDDPRRLTPGRRQMAALRPEEPTDEPLAELPVGAEHTALWDAAARRRATRSKVSDCELNRARGRLLVPSATPQALRLPAVPVLLMQNSSPPGWDLVLPAGWGMTFWVALQYQGARAGALRETDRMALEMGRLRFPAEFPDSEAGRLWDAEERTQRRLEYFKRPPAKRPCYTKLAVPDPFECPWPRLLRRLCPSEGAIEAGSVRVCRDRATLALLTEAMERLFLPGAEVQPQREVIGHVTSGDFCLSEAGGRGTGFVVLEGLLRLLESGGRQLLFRNTDATAYRWCEVTLVTEHC